uniref:Proteasome assembly chaperone 2 n=1 Tax=Felis catus TaxID=9685 RepID=A0ABI7WZV4_FELCA
KFVPGNRSLTPGGFTILMPAVPVGNVGQLVIDWIISMLHMCKIGYFYTTSLGQMVGNCPYATAEVNSIELSTDAEVYSLPSKKLVALQLRSIFIKYKSNSNCAKVIVLSSSHSYHCNDLHFILARLPSDTCLHLWCKKTVQNKIETLNWEEMEKSPCIPEIDDFEFCIYIPGGSITKILYTEGCFKEIPDAVLLKFVSEEDNILDALILQYLSEWLHINHVYSVMTLQRLSCGGNAKFMEISLWKWSSP